MKYTFALAILLITIINAFAQHCDPAKFKKLIDLSNKKVVTNSEFSDGLVLVKNLELNNCPDYDISKNGVDSVLYSLTALFGNICLKNNSLNAVKEYIKYVKRHHGSAEEEISFSFERLFVQRPQDILLLSGNNNDLLNLLEWGFLNNHDELHITPSNYKRIFFKINPKVKSLYPQYKKQIDYLLKAISSEISH